MNLQLARYSFCVFYKASPERLKKLGLLQAR